MLIKNLIMMVMMMMALAGWGYTLSPSYTLYSEIYRTLIHALKEQIVIAEHTGYRFQQMKT